MYLNYKFLFSLSIIIIIIINTINCNNSNVHNEHKCHEYLAKHTLNSKIIIKAKPYLKLKPTSNSAQSAPSTTIKYSKHLIQQQQQQLQHQQQQESSILFHIEYIYLNNQTLTGLNLITIGASSPPPPPRPLAPLAPTIQSPIHKSNNRKPLVQQAQHQHQQYSTILIQNFGLTTTTKITTQNNTIKASTTTTTNNQCELNNNNINGEIDFTKSYILFIDKNNLTTEFYNLIKLNANKPIRERVPKLELIQIKNSNSFIQHNEYNENTIKSFICDNCVKKPYVYDMPETTYATINNMLQITCKYNGNPIPKIIWRKENNVLHSNNYLNNQTRRFHIITKNNYSTLNIYKVTNEDRGTYHCIAHDYINNNDIIKSTKVVILTQQQQQLQSRKPFVTSTTLFKLPTPTTLSPKTTILNNNRRLSSTIKPINNNNNSNNNNNKNIKNNNNNNNNKNNIIDYANFEPCGNSQLYIKCFHGGTCYKSKYNRKGDANFNEFCICKHLYSGKQCEIDMGFLLDTNYKYKNRDSVPNEFKNLYDKLINNNNNKDKTKGTVING